MSKKTWQTLGITPALTTTGITIKWTDLEDTGLEGGTAVTPQQFTAAFLVKLAGAFSVQNRETNPDETISIEPAQAVIDNFTDPENPKLVTGYDVRAYTPPPSNLVDPDLV